MKENKSNALRFIEAYNKIDKALRAQHNIKPSVPFSQMLRQLSPQNSLISKYEDELSDYARLRNCIVHGMTGQIIAQPSDDVVTILENIEKLLTEPPAATQVLGKQDILVLSADASLKDAVLSISKYKYSHIPVISQSHIIGVLNSKVLVKAIGKRLSGNNFGLEEFLEKTKIKDIITIDEIHYAYAGSEISIAEAMTAFHQNRRLQALILTRTGERVAPITAIITATDIIRFGNVLDKIQQF